MCGVAGWLGVLPDPPGTAKGLASSLRHRGPDASGYRCWQDAALVNTRLKVIDLSPLGDQPLANETSEIWAVLNGEIYNHHKLRQQLQDRGHTFRGHSDTEIIPHLYEEHGDRLAEHLRGMFAFAIYDDRAKRLVLGRDPFGIKPLFFAAIESNGGSALAFASELRSLLRIPGIDDSVDRQALFDLLALTYIPGPQTFYNGIRAVQPGQTLVASLSQGRVERTIRRYHRWAIAPDASLTLEAAALRTDELLDAAVGRQMESDVPLGALLSGGIDSSLVAAAASSQMDGDLRTFNVKFSEGAYDETWAARAVADHIGSSHETFEMESGRGGWEEITALLAHAGQPFADTSLFATHAVCQRMREQVTVALSGDGGDEGFGGYDTYWRIAQVVGLQRVPAPLWGLGSAGMDMLSRLTPRGARFARHASKVAGADNVGIVQHLMSYVRPEEQQHLMPHQDLEPTRRLFEPQWSHNFADGHPSRVDRLSALVSEVRVRLSLASDYLFKVDTASMREGLEVRVPMLDEDLFAFGLTLPHSLKVQDRTCKRVLRTLAERKLPAKVAVKPKWGFGVPMDTWVSGDFKRSLGEYLLDPGGSLADSLEPNAYVPIIEAFVRGESASLALSREGLYQRVFSLLSVQVIVDATGALRIERLRAS